MKRVFVLFLVCLLLCALAVPAAAEEEAYIYDTVGLLTQEEWDDLHERAAAVSRQTGCGIYVAVLDDMGEYDYYDIEAFAEAVYTSWELGLGEEQTGIMLILSMAGRDYDLAAHGSAAHYAFTDYGKDRLADEFLDNFRQDDWYGGFADYIDACSYYLSYAEQGEPIDIGYGSAPVTPRTVQEKLRTALPVSLLAGVVIALIACSVMKGKMKSAKIAADADEYVAPGGVRIENSRDRFSHTTQTRVRIESDSSRSGGGGTHVSSGGFSHSSGKF